MTRFLQLCVFVPTLCYGAPGFGGQASGGGGGGTALPRDDYDYILNGGLYGTPLEINGEEFTVNSIDHMSGELGMSTYSSGKVLTVLPAYSTAKSGHYSTTLRQDSRGRSEATKRLSDEAIRKLTKAVGEQN
ncbi:MAG: hypothetical protein EOP48_06055 [Sphingobacteriales bacterium]|nr:MAG: hypothetical protein EOP48_06055 [Sphingobacteriales bacterium]